MTDPSDPYGLDFVSYEEMQDALNEMIPKCRQLEEQLAEAQRRDRYHLALLAAYSQLLGAVEEWDGGWDHIVDRDLNAALQQFKKRHKEIKDEHKRTRP